METMEKIELDFVKLMTTVGKSYRYMSDENGSIAFTSNTWCVSSV